MITVTLFFIKYKIYLAIFLNTGISFARKYLYYLDKIDCKAQ